MNYAAKHGQLRPLIHLIAITLVLAASTSLTAQESTRSADDLRRDRLNAAKLAYKHAFKKAGETSEAKRLNKKIDDNEFLMKAAESRAREPEYQPRYSRGIGLGGFGIGGVARRIGEGAGRATAAKHAEQHRRAMEIAENDLDAHLKKSTWSFLNNEEQDLFIEFFPDFVREAGAGSRLPKGAEGSRPNSWVKFTPPGMPFAYWAPVKPERDGGPGIAYRAVVSKGNTEYLMVSLDLGPAARPSDDPKFIKRMVEGLAKPVDGNVVHSSTCTLLGKPAHQATIEFLDVGIPRHLSAKCVAEGTKIYLFSVLQAQDQAGEPLKDWFFDSIEAN